MDRCDRCCAWREAGPPVGMAVSRVVLCPNCRAGMPDYRVFRNVAVSTLTGSLLGGDDFDRLVKVHRYKVVRADPESDGATFCVHVSNNDS